VIDLNTPFATSLRISLDGKLVGGVVRASVEDGWIDAYVVREVAGRRTWTTEVERVFGIVSLSSP
jgi:hypothetical protein